MTDLIDTTEMYLRTILELEEEGIVPLARAFPSGSATRAPQSADGGAHGARRTCCGHG